MLAVARWEMLRRRRRTIAVLLAALAAELLLVHLQAYHGLIDLPTDPVVTGRDCCRCSPCWRSA